MKLKSTLTKHLMLLLLITFAGNVSAQVFWSEDFADGIPADWTNEDPSIYDALWTYCVAAGAGCSPSFGQGAFASTTALNGYITVNSDAVVAQQPADPHISTLTTSAIDCSGQMEVFASFEGQIGIYELGATGNALLLASTDGINWVEFNVYEGLDTPNSYSANPQLSVIDISSVASNQPTVYLRIQWTANWEYFWNIDDLALSANNPTPPNDIRVNDNFFAIAPNARTPISQVETFGFLADIENIGSAAQTNVELTVTIQDEANPATNVYEETLSYGTVIADTLVENIPFDGDGYTPPAVVSTYVGQYTITSDSVDSNPDNNSLAFDFEITEDLFAKDRGITSIFGSAEGNWDPDEPFSWAYGNHYHVVNGAGWWAKEAVFGIGNAGDPGVAGKTISVSLYEWVNANEDNEANPDERTLVGFAEYTIQGTEGTTEFDLITIPLLSISTFNEGVSLSDDTDYILMLEYNATDQTSISFLGSNEYDYSAQALRSLAAGAGRFGSMLGVNEPLATEPYTQGGFGGGANVPIARMIITDDIGSAVTTLSADNKITVFPSPATDHLDVTLDLVDVQSEVSMRVIDISGKVLEQRNYTDLQTGQFRFGLSAFPVGSYFLNVDTASGVRNIPFVIQR